jgi:hypothetical protein
LAMVMSDLTWIRRQLGGRQPQRVILIW